MKSKTNPTKAQKEWWDYLAGLGCTACRETDHVTIHHLTGIGGSRKVLMDVGEDKREYINIGHWAVIPLCPQCHQYGPNAIHRSKDNFRVLYGPEIDLLQECFDGYLDQYGEGPFSVDILKSIYNYLYLSYDAS